MKNEFLKQMKEELAKYQMNESERLEILEDYQNIIEEAVNKGLTEEEVMKKLGSPKRIVNQVCEGYSRIKQKDNGGKFIALTPFIATIAFMMLGFTYNLWHIGWLVFLIIPVSAILIEERKSKLALLLTALSPFISVIVFFILGMIYDAWHPGWLVFFIIPIFGILTDDRSFKRDLFLLIFILSIGAYIILGYNYNLWDYGLLVFLVPTIAGYFLGYVSLYVSVSKGDKDWKLLLVILISIVVFILVGSLFGAWHPAWLVFLLIPISAIVLYANDDREHLLVSLSPFVAVTIFILLGTLFNAWHPGWLVFLIIPMTAIVTE